MAETLVPLSSSDIIQPGQTYEIHFGTSGVLTGLEQQVLNIIISVGDLFSGATIVSSRVSGNEIIFRMKTPVSLSLSSGRGAKAQGLFLPLLVPIAEFIAGISPYIIPALAFIGIALLFWSVYLVITGPIGGAIAQLLPILGIAAVLIAGAFAVSALKGSSMDISSKGLSHRGRTT